VAGERPGQRELLLLEARDLASPAQWRWALTDAAGAFVAEHEVRLDAASWQFEAFTDLEGYLSWHAAPDRRAEDEDRIVAELGTWIGSQVLGPVADALAERRPVTVRVLVSQDAGDAKRGAVAEGATRGKSAEAAAAAAGAMAERAAADALLSRPLELAHAHGKPLAVQDVTLVMQPEAGDGTQGHGARGHGSQGHGAHSSLGDWRGGAGVPPGGRLRVLGLFSLPEGSSAARPGP
jgi:hypothetical protein